MIKKSALKSIFRLKKNFAPGVPPPARCFSGIQITPFRGGALASATISADFELSWAWRGWRSAQETQERAIRERLNVPHLIGLLEEYGIPITWATVGHLFLEGCGRGEDGRAHPQMPRPPALTTPPAMARWTGDWYRHDPCTDYRTDGLWYCPDLIEQILSTKVRHELGSHSFSHISFLAENSTPDLVKQELAQCQAAMSPFRLSARSLVYPYNQMGHHYDSVLAKFGITCVRHRDPLVRLSYPERLSSGVYKLYESMNLRRSRRYNYLEKVRIFLEEAMKRQAAYHLWFHPSDPVEIFDREFRGIIQHMAQLQRRGNLWIATMADLAAYCEAREQTTLNVQRNADELNVALRCNYDLKRYGKTVLTLRVTSNCMPSECQLRTETGWEPVEWKSEQPHVGAQKGASFLVDVPVTGSETCLVLRHNHDRKYRHTATIADPAPR
jgi:peptidoglycan/xylan/chitin deacetylase (PgdA/CDA1 family)